MKRKPTSADLLLWTHLTELCPNDACREFRFHYDRRWRFDFAIPHLKIAIEIDGGAFTGGRHVRGVGFVKDMEKGNFAALLRWRVLRFAPQDVLNGKAIAFIKLVLES